MYKYVYTYKEKRCGQLHMNIQGIVMNVLFFNAFI